MLKDGLEIKPSANYILVKPYLKNPYESLEIRKSGLILEGDAAKFKNPDNGDEEEEQYGVIVAKVIEVGPECKWTKSGDDIYYLYNSQIPIPFYRQGLQCVSESRIMMIINTNLTERYV